jgi:hypothetical protein
MTIATFALTMFAFAAAQPRTAPVQPAPPAAQAQLPTATQIAQTLQSQVPIDLGNGIRANAVSSEGETLVWTIDIPAEVMAGHNVGEVTEPLRIGFCSGPGAAIFLRGISLRIDVGIGGGPPARGDLITSCPAA